MKEELIYTVWLVIGQQGREVDWQLYGIFLFRREAKEWLFQQSADHDIRYRIVKGDVSA